MNIVFVLVKEEDFVISACEIPALSWRMLVECGQVTRKMLCTFLGFIQNK